MNNPRTREVAKSRNQSVEFHPAAETLVVTVVVLQRGLRIAPAVVAAAVVEIDEPKPLDLDAELHDRFGPLSDNALIFFGDRGGDWIGTLRIAIEELTYLGHSDTGNPLYLGQQCKSFLVTEDSLSHGGFQAVWRRRS